MGLQHVERFADHRTERVPEGFFVGTERLEGSDGVEDALSRLRIGDQRVGHQSLAKSSEDRVTHRVGLLKL